MSRCMKELPPIVFDVDTTTTVIGGHQVWEAKEKRTMVLVIRLMNSCWSHGLLLSERTETLLSGGVLGV